jgi:hypothetical protein
MSEILIRYTQYEIIIMGSTVLSIIIGLIIATHLLTKDKRAVLTVAVAQLISSILNSSTLLIAKQLFDINLSDFNILLSFITLLISSMNISILIGEYNTRLGRKNFDIDHVTRAHFSTTLNTTIIVTLTTLAIIVFTEDNVKINMLLFLIPTISSIWITHLLSRRMLRDE